MQQAAVGPPLRIAGDFAALPNQVGLACDAGVQRSCYAPQDFLDAAADVAPGGPPIEREYKAIVQAAGSEYNGAAAGASPQDFNAVVMAGLRLDLFLGASAPPDHDDRTRRFPTSQSFFVLAE